MGANAAVRRAGRRPARMLLGAYLVTVFALVTLNFSVFFLARCRRRCWRRTSPPATSC
jgi:hypothetical protein